jgi:putative endonuclease
MRRSATVDLRGEPGIQPHGIAVGYYVYLLASRKHDTLYLGVTNDLIRRVYEHKTKAVPGFTSRYGVDRLVWYECYDDPTTAITRERSSRSGAGIGRSA